MTELAWRSAALFRKAGQPDSAAQLLEKASLALGGDRQRDNSVLMLEKAVETVETENRPIQVGVPLVGGEDCLSAVVDPDFTFVSAAQAACYVNKLLHMALERNDLAEATAKARKLVELYQVGRERVLFN